MHYRLIFSSAIFAAVLILLFSSSTVAQSSLEADAVAFRYDNSHAEVDINYGVLQRALSFTKSGTTWTAYTSAKAEIWQNDKVIDSKAILDTVHFKGSQAQFDSASAEKLLGAMGFAVPYGSPTIAAFIWNENDGKRSDTIKIPVVLPDRDTSKCSFGGVELASSIVKSTSDKPGPFDRAGVTMTPNPSSVFGENYTKLYYYTELYVPPSIARTNGSAEIETDVIDASDAKILSNTENVPVTSEAVPIILSLDIDGLSSDAYKLRILAKFENAVQAEAEKTFYYSSGMKISEEAPPPVNSAAQDSVIFAESDFAKMSEAEAEVAIAQAMYWGREVDQQAAKKLPSLSEKQHFLFSFWRSQDASRHAAQPLDVYRVFKTRVDQANKDYSFEKTPGWKTGRGRVYITYGPPKTIGTHSFDPGYKPYITWQYDSDPNIHLIAGNFAEFDFVDRMGGGNYYLVSANVLGESYDPNWLTTEALRLGH